MTAPRSWDGAFAAMTPPRTWSPSAQLCARLSALVGQALAEGWSLAALRAAFDAELHGERGGRV